MTDLKIMTYNIHKGFSILNRSYTLDAIKTLLHSVNPDLVFLQEVRGLCSKGQYKNQFEHLADTLWPHSAYGENAIFTEAHHGNAILSRFPMLHFDNNDITLHRFEKRGILYGKLNIPAPFQHLHVFCLHLNLLERHRMQQVESLLRLLGTKVPQHEPVIVAGDFNDWTGEITKQLKLHMDCPTDRNPELTTYPSFFPIFQLDRIFTRNVRAFSIERLSDPQWRHLSDHLPLVARITMGL